jgi:hypothetical protein
VIGRLHDLTVWGGGAIRRSRLDLQLKLFKIMTVAAVIYGSEMWIVIKNRVIRTQTAKMKFVLGVAGFIHIDNERNTETKKD